MGRMCRRPKGLVRLALAGVLGLMLVPGVASAGTLDQQQTSASSGGSNIDGPGGGGLSKAQTFTAGLSGGLDQVDLHLFRDASGPLTVEIRDVVGGAPGSTTLASASVPAADVPIPSGVFVVVPFASPAPVTAGTQYAIVAYTGGSDRYFWGFDGGGPYSAGSPFASFASPPTTWTGFSGDLAFKTYVAVPSALPTTKEDCKNGGWQNYDGRFKNQGDCVSFVASGGKNPPANP